MCLRDRFWACGHEAPCYVCAENVKVFNVVCISFPFLYSCLYWVLRPVWVSVDIRECFTSKSEAIGPFFKLLWFMWSCVWLLWTLSTHKIAKNIDIVFDSSVHRRVCFGTFEVCSLRDRTFTQIYLTLLEIWNNMKRRRYLKFTTGRGISSCLRDHASLSFVFFCTYGRAHCVWWKIMYSIKMRG